MTTDELRAKFEMFCKENHWCVNRQRNGDYKSMLIENMWIGYRAAYVSREDEIEMMRDIILDREMSLEMRKHEVEVLRKDAERYRWLVENAEIIECQHWHWWNHDSDVTPIAERIDASMREESK